jgi:hypothetical protein
VRRALVYRRQLGNYCTTFLSWKGNTIIPLDKQHVILEEYLFGYTQRGQLSNARIWLLYHMLRAVESKKIAVALIERMHKDHLKLIKLDLPHSSELK